MDFFKGIGDFFGGWFGADKRKRIQEEMRAAGEKAYQHAQATPAHPPVERQVPNLAGFNNQARFNQMRRGGMGHAEAQAKIQAEKDAINQRIWAKQAKERQAYDREHKEPLYKQIEQARQAFNSSSDISQLQKDAFNQRADKLKKKIGYVGRLDSQDSQKFLMPDLERFTKLNQRANDAYSLAAKVYKTTGDVNRARQVLQNQLYHSDEMTKLEDQERDLRDTAKGLAQLSAPVRGLVGWAGSKVYDGADLLYRGGETLSDLTNWQEAKQAFKKARQSNQRNKQQALETAGTNKSEYDGMLYDIGAGAGQLAEDMAMASVGLSPVVASRRAADTGTSTYLNNREQGKGKIEALFNASGNAIAQYYLEKVPLDNLVKPTGSRLTSGLIGGVLEGVQEGGQEVVDNLFNNRKWDQNVIQAGLMGAGLGSVAKYASDGLYNRAEQAKTQARQDIDAQYSRQTQPVQNALAKVMADRQIDEAVRFKLVSDEQAGQLQPAYDPINNQLIKKELRAEADNRSYMRETNSALDNQGSVSDHNIAQAPEDVNPDLKFKLSPEQEAFFKDSKIRDGNGNLKPMHHGTSARFNQFSPESIEQDNLGRGFYFTDNEAIANSYANRRTNERGGEPRVMETFLNVKKPFDLNHQPREIALDYLTHYFSKNGESNENAIKQANEFLDSIVNDGDVIDDNYNVVFSTAEPEFQDWVKSKGYDGLIVPGKDRASGLKGDAVVVFKPNQIKYTNNSNPTNNPDMRYKISQKSTEIQSSLDELKARHFKLTGDNDIAFNAFAEAIQDIGNIEGYYDPKTNTVHIGELAEYVLNHEVVHKTLRKHMELRPEIMQATADKFGIDNIIAEYNQKGYGDQAVNGHTLDAGEPKDVRLAVEEKVADEFNTYLDQYQKGRANYYANKVGLSPTIRAWFDRIIEGLKEFFGQADKIKQFYAQLETGKFSTDDNIGVLERTVSRLEDSIAYKRNPDAAKRALAGFNMVKNGWRKQATLTQLTADSAERYRQTTGLTVSDNAKLVLTNDTINHLRNSGHLTGEGVRGRIDRNPLTDADIANIHEVFNNPDEIKLIGDGRLGKRISVSKTISKNHRLGVDLISDGTDFYVVTYFNKSRSPQQVQASSSEGAAELNPLRPRPERSSEAYADNIPQTDENIKYKMSDEDIQRELAYQKQLRAEASSPETKEYLKNIRQVIRDYELAGGDSNDNNPHLERLNNAIRGFYQDWKTVARPSLTDSLEHRYFEGELEPQEYLEAVTSEEQQAPLENQVGILTQKGEVNKRFVEKKQARNLDGTILPEQQVLPDENIDADKYIKEQVKAQKRAEKSSSNGKFGDAIAQVRHHLVDDAIAYERYMTKDQKKFLKDEIRNDIDKVRSSEMIAQQFIRDNGLAELGKLSTKELNQFQQYLIARRHAADLHKKGIKTGRDLQADLAIIQKYKNKFKNEEKIFREFNKRLLGYMEKNGLISQDLHTELSKNKAYAPYQRLMDDISGFTGHSQQLGNLDRDRVIRSMKGSERTILNPIEATMANTLRIINEGQRNIAARKIAENLFSENRLKDWQKPRAGYDTLNFLENGKKVTYEVPKLVASEMKRLNRVLPEGVERIVNVLSVPAKTLRAGATSLNPMFAASNLVRDQFQTTITGNLKTTIQGTPQALLATFGWGKKANALRAELSRQGIIGSEYRQTYGYKQGDLMKELQKEHKLTKKAVDRISHPIDALNDLIGRTEYFTRAQQYFGTSGDVVAKSQAARNNTLNFSRGGEAVMVLNKIIPFLNAGVQGGRQITNQFAKRPVRTTLALAAWAGVAAAIKGISEADEKKKQLYDRISDYEKRTNLILFGADAKYNPETGRIDGLIKIPIPQFLYPITDGINNTKGRPEDFLKVAGNVFEVFTGINTENPVSQLTPTAIKPFIEAATNTNMFTGRDIVSEYDAEKDPADKGAKYTTGAARFLAGLTGVDAPVIDNFIQNWSGGLGKDLAKTLTDNPDNAKDGGGLERIFSEGAYRRFGSVGAKSQYEMALASGEELKRKLKNEAGFNKLSKTDQEEVLKAITADSKAIGGAFGKAERGEEIKKDLSQRQEGLLQGFNSQQYREQVLKGGKEVNRERLYSENDYEYKQFKEDYNKKLAKGEYSRRGKIEADNRLKKLEAGKNFPKEIRDLYELGKDDLRKLVTTSQDGQYVLDEVMKYGDRLAGAGIIKRNKFRDKYGRLNIGERVERGSGSGRRTSTGVPSIYKVSTDMLLKGLRESKASGKFQTIKSYNISRGRRIRNLKRLNGGRTVSLKKR